MNEQQLKVWRQKNEQLQQAYRKYYNTYGSQRDTSLKLIEIALRYTPFMNYIHERDGCTTGLVRHGLDYQTESAISEIDKIAKGELQYEY